MVLKSARHSSLQDCSDTQDVGEMRSEPLEGNENARELSATYRVSYAIATCSRFWH